MGVMMHLEHRGTHGARLRVGAHLDELWLHHLPRLASNDKVRTSFSDAVGVTVDVAVMSLRWPRI